MRSAFSSEQRKDLLAFIEEVQGVRVQFRNLRTARTGNQTSAPFPRGVNEMEKCGLAPARSRLVKLPRVAASPCAPNANGCTVSLAD
jgi:flavin reductase (DIM6/NTAB) family NADH-FMN oxidoreductase RutF